MRQLAGQSHNNVSHEIEGQFEKNDIYLSILTLSSKTKWSVIESPDIGNLETNVSCFPLLGLTQQNMSTY